MVWFSTCAQVYNQIYGTWCSTHLPSSNWKSFRRLKRRGQGRRECKYFFPLILILLCVTQIFPSIWWIILIKFRNCVLHYCSGLVSLFFWSIVPNRSQMSDKSQNETKSPILIWFQSDLSLKVWHLMNYIGA